MLTSLFRRRGLIGVDTGNRTIKVAQVRAPSRSRCRLIGHGSALTPPGACHRGQIQDVRALGDGIRKAVEQAGATARRAALVIPAHVGFVRRLTFPRMPLKELRAAIDLQPERYIPFAREGTVYDLHVLPEEDGADEMAVVLAAAPRRHVEALMAAARRAGLLPVRVDLEPLTLYRAALMTGQASPEQAVGILDMGASGAKLHLFDGYVPVMSRVIDLPGDAEGGAPDLTPEVSEGLFWDIRRSLEFALTQMKRPLTRLLVTGGAGDEYLALALGAYLRSLLANRLPEDFTVEPVHDKTGQVPHSHMVAFGLSLPPELFV